MNRPCTGAAVALAACAWTATAVPQTPGHVPAGSSVVSYQAMYGGDAQHTGRTDRRGPRSAPSIVWRVRTGRRVFGSPTVDRAGRVVVGSLDGTVQALDIHGIERWGAALPGRIFSTAAVVEGRTVIGHDGGGYVALDARGQRTWTFPTAEDADAPPVVGLDGTVYVASASAAALGADGRARWTTPLEGHVFGAPALSADGSILVVTELRGAVVFMRVADGTVVRRVRLPAAVRGGVLALADGAVVVGSDDGHVRCIAADGSTRWDTGTVGVPQRQGVRTTPALGRDGTVIVGADDGGIYGLRPADGTVGFRVSTGGPVRSSARVDADGWIYQGSEDDHVWALRPDGTVGWTVAVGADVDGTPALPADGVLVVGSDDGAIYGLSAGEHGGR